MNSSLKKINHPSGQQDLYKSVIFPQYFDAYGAKQEDVGVVVHATTTPQDIFYVELRGNNNPMPFPKTGLELIKPKN